MVILQEAPAANEVPQLDETTENGAERELEVTVNEFAGRRPEFVNVIGKLADWPMAKLPKLMLGLFRVIAMMLDPVMVPEKLTIPAPLL